MEKGDAGVRVVLLAKEPGKASLSRGLETGKAMGYYLGEEYPGKGNSQARAPRWDVPDLFQEQEVSMREGQR